MGQYEILEFMRRLRETGDDDYYRYHEVHQKMVRDGRSNKYGVVWRGMLQLHRAGFLEVVWEGELLRRNPRFRARIGERVQSSHKKEVNNIYPVMVEKSCKHSQKGPIAAKKV